MTLYEIYKNRNNWEYYRAVVRNRAGKVDGEH